MYVDFCIFIFLQFYIYTFLYVYICICLYFYMFICLYFYIYIFLFFLYIFIFLYFYILIFLNFYIFIFLYFYIFIRTNISLVDTLIPSSFIYFIYMGGTGLCDLSKVIFGNHVYSWHTIRNIKFGVLKTRVYRFDYYGRYRTR